MYSYQTFAQRHFGWLARLFNTAVQGLAVTGIGLLIVAIPVCIFLIGPMLLMWAWNTLCVAMWGWPVLTFWPAVAGCVLLWLISRIFRR